MSRWLLLACSLMLLAALAYGEPARRPGGSALGGECLGDRDCQTGLTCAQMPGVIEGQCAARCNSTPACQERFGTESVCLGADVCARTCGFTADCPAGAICNLYGWCER